MQANVQVYEMTAEGKKEVDTLRGTAKSGRKPGMGEMMGVGAIAGHLLASTVVSGALSGASEMTSATVEADANAWQKRSQRTWESFLSTRAGSRRRR